jgi:hypothetical protein
MELLPKRIPYISFDLEPMVRVAILFLAFRFFGIQLWLSVGSRDRDYVDVLFIRDLSLYAWSAFPFDAPYYVIISFVSVQSWSTYNSETRAECPERCLGCS